MTSPLGFSELTKALVAAQAEFAPLEKTATNPHFKNKFVPLSEVLQNALPVLSKHGLAVAQFPTFTDDGPALITYLLHESGQYLAHSMPLNAVKSDPQAQGSAITYARRYSLMSILGLVGDEDDDANAATSAPKQRAPRPTPPSSPLDIAKEQLRAAIKGAGLTSDQAKEYAWVATATNDDIDRINGAAEVLKMGVAKH